MTANENNLVLYENKFNNKTQKSWQVMCFFFCQVVYWVKIFEMNKCGRTSTQVVDFILKCIVFIN